MEPFPKSSVLEPRTFEQQQNPSHCRSSGLSHLLAALSIHVWMVFSPLPLGLSYHGPFKLPWFSWSQKLGSAPSARKAPYVSIIEALSKPSWTPGLQ